MKYNFLEFLTSGLHANETVLNDVNPPHAVAAAMTWIDRQTYINFTFRADTLHNCIECPLPGKVKTKPKTQSKHSFDVDLIVFL